MSTFDELPVAATIGGAAASEPYYFSVGHEVEIFERCHRRGLPVLLKGPTGCGKTRFVEPMAWRLGQGFRKRGTHDP